MMAGAKNEHFLTQEDLALLRQAVKTTFTVSYDNAISVQRDGANVCLARSACVAVGPGAAGRGDALMAPADPSPSDPRPYYARRTGGRPG